jgi:CBS domain-containing protein
MMTEVLPIQTHEIIGTGGARARALRVFCPSRTQSVDLETCMRCPHLESVSEVPEARGACIACTPPTTPAAKPSVGRALESSFAHLAATSLVGGIVGSHVTCVEPDVSMVWIDEEFGRRGVQLFPVVEPSRRLLGFVWRGDLLRPRWQLALSDPRDSLRAGALAVEVMDKRVFSVRESDRVTEVVRVMTVDRARTVAVLAEDDTVVGLVSDLDLLRWFAATRRWRFSEQLKTA